MNHTTRVLSVQLAAAGAVVAAIVVFHHPAANHRQASVPISSPASSASTAAAVTRSQFTPTASATFSAAARRPTPSRAHHSAQNVKRHIAPAPPRLRPRPTPTRSSSSTPDKTALAAARIWESFDTTLDTTPYATTLRAAPWLTPTFLDTIRHTPPTSAAGSDWAQWSRHHARAAVTATIAGDDRPHDTPTTVSREVLVTVTPLGRDGWRGMSSTHVDVLTLTNTRFGWRVTAVLSGI